MNKKSLAGYQLIGCLDQKKFSSVHRGQKRNEDSTVILKVVDKETAQLDALNQLRNEYEILQKLPTHPGIPQAINLIDDGAYLVLILSDFEGETLDQAMSDGSLLVEQVVNILTQTAHILELVHHQNIIHKDLKPSNILWNKEKDTVQIIDFGLSVPFNQKLNQYYQPGLMDGSLCYMSPEQTGRVNRSVDYRSDFYALGITAYELLCHRRPFGAELNIDQLLYSILAVESTPPCKVKKDIPESLSAIVMRLIAKDAEDRYQTSKGLLHDLSQCLSSEEFSLGALDISSHFQPPKKVYGREFELELLERSLSKASSGNIERVLVSGYSGVGKTALVHELYTGVQKLHGNLIEGKFDQLQRNQPLYALTQAFNEFFGAVLVESDQDIERWRQRLTSQLGENVGVMTHLIPHLEHLLGHHDQPLYLAGEEGLNRLVFTFLALIRLVAKPHQPLIIFIDDLQWIDLASLMLIEALFRADDLKHVLFIGAYRDNEVSEGHPLSDLIHTAQSEKLVFHEIKLGNLDIGSLTGIINDGLQNRLIDSEVLAEQVHKKTAGNPFFTIQFVSRLVDDQVIELGGDGYWRYQADKLVTLSVADNVVGLMLDKIRTFPSHETMTLSTAAAIGHEFTQDNLAIIIDQPVDQVKDTLLPFVHAGILNASEDTFYFAHDGIQKAAYQITSESERASLHLRIGFHLLSHYQDDEKKLRQHLFDICFHLNRSKKLIERAEDRLTLVELNIQAAFQAKQSSAYQSALDYISVAVGTVENADEARFDALKYSVYREAAECAYLCGDYVQAERYFDLAEVYASNPFETCQIINLRVVQMVSKGDYVSSMVLGIKGASLYGIELPDVSDTAGIDLAYTLKLETFKKEWIQKGHDIADLYDLPVNEASEIALVMELLGSLYASALMSFPNYLKVITIELVNLSVKHGNTSTSPIAYAWHGSTVTATSDHYDDGYAFGQLAICLNEQKIKNPTIACKIYNMVGNFINFFKEPIRAILPILRRAYTLGMASGDKLYGGYSIINELRNALSTGMPLSKWLTLDDEVKLKLEQCDAMVMVEVRESFRAYALLLTGKSESPVSLDNPDFSEKEYREKYAEVPLFGSLLDAWKIQSSFHLGLYEDALAISLRDSSSIESFVLGVEMRFFVALTMMHFLKSDPNNERASEWQSLFDVTCERVESLADSCPENFRHMLLILRAEEAGLAQKSQEALSLFNQAIQSAKENEFLQYQALANELAGQLCLNSGLIETGHIHLERAYRVYSAWGAVTKLDQLESSYPSIQFLNSQDNTDIDSGYRYMDRQEIAHRVDLKSIMTTSLALSSEIDIELLIERLMGVVLESSGAQKALLLLEEAGRWNVAANSETVSSKTVSNETSSRGTMGDREYSSQASEPADGKMPKSVLLYVLRTGKTLHLGDARTQKPYSNDRYVQEHNVKSLICLPLIHQGKTKAVFYLENNLAKHSFTNEHIQRLTLLSSQMASAIENSLNYQRLADSEHHYRRLLTNMPIGILVFNQTRLISYVNKDAARMLTLKPKMVDGVELSVLDGQLVDEDGFLLEGAFHPLNKIFETGESISGIVCGYKKSDASELRWFIISAFPQFSNNVIDSVVTCLIDITERRLNEAKIEHLAYFDALTDLPNRVNLEKKLQTVIHHLSGNRYYSAVMLLDIDNFKVINDSLGHWVGDELLKQVSVALTDIVGSDGFVARLGGDEFAIVLFSCISHAEVRKSVDALAHRIQKLFSNKFVVKGRQLITTTSIGVSVIPVDGVTVDELLRRADSALYTAKKAGRNQLIYFEIAQETDVQRRLELEGQLRIALETNQFCLLYQPKVDVATDEIVGAEALVRWEHPTQGLISPIEFIPIAEESGLIVQLGEWILREACRQAKAWSLLPAFENFQRMSVNVSPFQFKDAAFQSVVKQALADTALSPTALDLEITETLLLDNIDLVIEKLHLLKRLGISFSIDDFGTGYSSLSYLKQLPVDVVKIDQSFVRDMTSDEGDFAIVQTIIAMAKSLRLKTVAEGVETLEHLEALRDLGCGQFQGYYFSKPITPEAFELLIRS